MSDTMKYLVFIFLAFSISKIAQADTVSECPHENGETILQDYLYDIHLPLIAMQYFNIGKPDEARAALANELSTIIVGLYQLLPHRACFQNEDELNRVWGMLRVLAVMHEKYPIAEWEKEKNVISALSNAKDQDLVHTEKIRTRDWRKQL